MAVWSTTDLSSVTHFDRIDGEYYLPSYLSNHDILSSIETVPLPQRFLVSDGNHLSVSKYFSDNAEIPYFRGQDVNDFFLENASPVRIPERVYKSSMMQRSHFQEADVLLSIVGTIGSLSVVPKSIGSATGSCKIAILRSKGEYSPFLLAAFLLSRYGQLQIKRNTRGAVQMGLILKDLIRIRVPLFSSKSILEIEELVKNAIVSNNLSKEFHDQSQQILESKLGLDKLSFQKPVGYTAQFSEMELSRRLDAQHYQAQFTQLLSHLAKFPSRIVREIRTCNRRGIQPIYVTDGTYEVINSQHLGPKHINYDGLQKTSPKAFAASPVAHIRQNDLLIYTTGAYIGRTNVYLSDAPAFASNHVNILRITPDIDAAYMAMVFQSMIGQFQTQKHSRGSAQAELYPNDIDKFVVPILPFEQQTIIGDLVRESLIKKRESARLLEQAKTRVEQLIEEAAQA
jgi:restriction endonuclease S subunit